MTSLSEMESHNYEWQDCARNGKSQLYITCPSLNTVTKLARVFVKEEIF